MVNSYNCLLHKTNGVNFHGGNLALRMPDGAAPWALACSEYGERFVCAVRHGNCVATQFHPEKSGVAP